MPIYEYRCPACRKRTSVFVRSMNAPENATCEHCGSHDATRVFSRIAVHRSSDGSDFSEASLGALDESDPRSVAKWVRKMSREMGEPLDGDMQTELDRLESGESFDDDVGDDSSDDFSGLE